MRVLFKRWAFKFLSYIKGERWGILRKIMGFIVDYNLFLTNMVSKLVTIIAGYKFKILSLLYFAEILKKAAEVGGNFL